MTVQIPKQKPSKRFEQLLADLGPDFGKLETKKDAIFEQGRKEGFSDMEIGDLVRSKMKEHYSDRTIRRLLPDTAKQQQDHSKQKADKMSASERPPINLDDKDVKVEPVIETQEEPVTTESIRKIAENVLNLSPNPQPNNNKTIEQSGPKEIYSPGMPEKFGVEYFEIEKLNTYSLEYCRRSIRWLYEALEEFGKDCSKWDKDIRDQTLEIAALKKENADLRKELGK
jgi:hypothetical protein